jgi:hypothetical protein
MSKKTVYKYTYDDLKCSDNNCIVSTLKQISEITGMSYSTLKYNFSKRDFYFEPKGKFKVEKRVHKVCLSKDPTRNRKEHYD